MKGSIFTLEARIYGKPDHQASETVISESDEVMAGDGVMMGTDGIDDAWSSDGPEARARCDNAKFVRTTVTATVNHYGMLVD